MRYLRQSTQVDVLVGPFLDVTDGVTEEVGLAGGGTELSKAGAAFGAGPTLGTHDAEGWYPITLTTTHTNTVGALMVKSHNSGTHLPVWHEFTVIEEAIYDALFASSAAGFNASGHVTLANAAHGGAAAALTLGGGASISSASGSALTLSSSGGNGSGLEISGNGSGDGIRATGGATGHGISGVGGATSGVGVRGLGSAGNSQGILGVGQGSAAGIRGTGGTTGAGISGVGGATSGPGISAIASAGNNAGISAAGVGSFAGIRAVGGVTGAGINCVGGATSGAGFQASGTAGNSAGAQFSGQGSAAGLNATGGATGAGLLAVGGATSGHGIEATVTSGNEIDANITGNLSGSVGSLGATAKSDVNAEVDTALADINLDHLVGTATGIPAVPAGTYLDQIMDDGVATFDRTTDSLQAIADSGGGGPTAAQIADQVWDEARADHVGAGSFGEGAASVQGNVTGSVASVTGAVGSVTGAVGSVTGNVGGNVTGSVGSVVGHTAQTGDSFARLGAPVGASISADLATVDSNVDAIKAKTDNYPPGIKKNTALAAFEFFMADSADHVSAKTGLSVTAQRSIDGAAFGACANAVSEVASGIYKIDLAAADLNGDTITLLFTAAGADSTVIHLVTEP